MHERQLVTTHWSKRNQGKIEEGWRTCTSWVPLQLLLIVQSDPLNKAEKGKKDWCNQYPTAVVIIFFCSFLFYYFMHRKARLSCNWRTLNRCQQIHLQFRAHVIIVAV